MLKRMSIIMVIVGLFAIFFPVAIEAGDNGTVMERKALLTDLAIKYGVPPEIIKAIAYKETGMKQFQEDGQPVLNENEDGGIGMMQVTMTEQEMVEKGIDEQRLKDDIAYNIEVGIAQLLEKKAWSGTLLPAFSTGEMRDHLEGWYFAVLAYNGLEQRNDPNRSAQTYQDEIYTIIETRGLTQTSTPSSFDVSYNENGNIMRFEASQRLVNLHERVMTETTQTFTKGEDVFTFHPERQSINLRSEPNTTSERTTIPHAVPLDIVSGPYHDDKLDHHFVFYEVKRPGSKQTNYIASSYLRSGEVTLFTDIKSSNHEMREAVALLESRGALNGYPDGRFGTYRPLQRLHAAVILVNELGLTLPADYQPKSTDYNQQRELLIAEAHGLFTPYPDGTIRPRDSFKRSQMAIVLNRVYGERFSEPTTNARFTDIDETFSSYSEINRLAYNNVTAVAGSAFRPNESVTRGQFAVFLNRVDGLLLD